MEYSSKVDVPAFTGIYTYKVSKLSKITGRLTGILPVSTPGFSERDCISSVDLPEFYRYLHPHTYPNYQVVDLPAFLPVFTPKRFLYPEPVSVDLPAVLPVFTP